MSKIRPIAIHPIASIFMALAAVGSAHATDLSPNYRIELSKDTAFQVIRFAKAFSPRWIVIENVVNMWKWTRYAEFKTALEKLGYHLQDQILNSAHFGVPQSRRRLFLVADRQQMPPKVTPRKSEPKKIADIVDLNGTYKWTPLRQPNRAKPTLERAERGFAALVGLDHQIHSVGGDVPVTAQRAEAVRLESDELHDATSSHTGTTSRKRNASSP